MRTLRLFLLYILVAILVIILGGFVGWYFFLHVPQTQVTATDVARGLTSSAPSFTGGSTQKNISTIIGGGPADTSTTPSSPLWQVDKTPVAGMGFVKRASTTTLQYIERANGYVFTADLSQRSVTRMTETLMPKIYEAYVASDGTVIERSLDTTGSITTLIATIGATTSKTSTSTTQNTLIGKYIDKNIQSLSLDPKSHAIFYLISNTTGGVDGMTLTSATAKPKKIFSSTITHWIPTWLADGRLIITESAVDDLPGYSYSVGNDGTMTLLIGNVPGLTFLPHTSSKALLYGASSQGTLTLFTQGIASTTPTALDIKTVADKCVWYEGKTPIVYCAVPSTPPSGTFLGAWYRGAVHTTDDWWKIDLQRGVVQQIYSPKKSDGVSIDVERPLIDPTGTFITFINASDKSLWMLKITQ